MNKKQKPIMLEDFVRREDVHVQTLIYILMRRCNDALQIADPIIIKDAVANFEDTLSPYWNEEYKDKKQEIDGIKLFTKADIEPILLNQGTDISRLYDFEIKRILDRINSKVIIEKERMRYRALMTLAHQKNLLLEIEIERTIGKRRKIEEAEPDNKRYRDDEGEPV